MRASGKESAEDLDPDSVPVARIVETVCCVADLPSTGGVDRAADEMVPLEDWGRLVLYVHADSWTMTRRWTRIMMTGFVGELEQLRLLGGSDVPARREERFRPARLLLAVQFHLSWK
jgi:hypothetical protein